MGFFCEVFVQLHLPLEVVGRYFTLPRIGGDRHDAVEGSLIPWARRGGWWVPRQRPQRGVEDEK